MITEIDVKEALKKIDVEFRPYRILGARNPRMAYEALNIEGKVGTMLPCNVIIQAAGDGEVAALILSPRCKRLAIQRFWRRPCEHGRCWRASSRDFDRSSRLQADEKKIRATGCRLETSVRTLDADQ
ncbi:DUF302 domain-containing protein [Ensifer oleiphilus]|uniref:DUF302 domain-containing protein n=1 Tax=Ensifer oleiphilus TaxID=2742698 RepID=UPI001FEE91C1|nr:DUF302 domain-containing protein [Ensifer oleiphilus]